VEVVSWDGLAWSPCTVNQRYQEHRARELPYNLLKSQPLFAVCFDLEPAISHLKRNAEDVDSWRSGIPPFIAERKNLDALELSRITFRREVTGS